MIWIIGVPACISLLIFIAAWLCCRFTFAVLKKREKEFRKLPGGKQYAPHKERFRALYDTASKLTYEDVWIVSHDGLRLHARYYHIADGAPLQIMFHGYRSAAVRDFCGGLQTALEMGYNALLPDQRAHGESEGKYLSFGVLERRDCLDWVLYATGRFGAATRIVLYGMSMGAATVLMAAGLSLPENVIGIAADCGYTSPREIISKVIAEMGYPVSLVYPMIRLGGRLFARFDTQSASTEDAMRRCRIPVLFIHGEDDRFVPCEMSRRNYELCASENKRLLIVPHAGHGISYFEDEGTYLGAVREFLSSLNIGAGK